MKKVKKISSLVLMLMIVIMMMSTSVSAIYETPYNAQKITMSDVEVTNRIPTDNNATSAGGLVVGTANNRLYIFKAKEDIDDGKGGYKSAATLYYYSNAYSTAAPKKIRFEDGMIGHANGMSMDDDYLYVTGWKINGKSGTYDKSLLLRISRAAITALADGTTFRRTDMVNGVIKRTINGTSYEVLKEIKPVDTNGKPYYQPISAIARFKYDKTNNLIKFLVSYPPTDGTIIFTMATFQNGNFVVSTDPKDKLIVPIGGLQYKCPGDTKATTLSNTGFTRQDAFYEPSYGLYIPIWNNVVKTQSLILRVNMAPYIASHTGTLTLTPSTVTVLDFSANGYTQLEVESIALIKKTNDKSESCMKFVFDCNVISDNTADSYFLLKNQKNLTTPF